MDNSKIDNLPDTTKSKPKHIPIAQIIDLRTKGLSHAQIATLVGCSSPNVSRRLAPYTQHIDNLDNFKKHRADVYAVLQSKIFSYVTENKLEKANLQQLIWAAGVLADKERIERGLVSEITAHVDLTKTMDAINKQIAEVEARLGPVVDVEVSDVISESKDSAQKGSQKAEPNG